MHTTSSALSLLWLTRNWVLTHRLGTVDLVCVYIISSDGLRVIFFLFIPLEIKWAACIHGNYITVCVSQTRIMILETLSKKNYHCSALQMKYIATFLLLWYCSREIYDNNHGAFLLQFYKGSVGDFVHEYGKKQLFAKSFQFPCIEYCLWLFLPMFVIVISTMHLLHMGRSCDGFFENIHLEMFWKSTADTKKLNCICGRLHKEMI